MPLQVLTLYGAGTGGTQSAIAELDIPGDGMITAVDWSAYADLDADGEAMVIGLSFASSEDLNQNDVRSLISVVSGQWSLTTSGAGQSGFNKHVTFSPGIPVFAGERLYLHAVGSASVTSFIHACIHLDTSAGVVGSMRAASRRR